MKRVYKLEGDYLVYMDDILDEWEERITFENSEYQIQIRNSVYQFSSNSSETCPEDIDRHSWRFIDTASWHDEEAADIEISCFTPWYKKYWYLFFILALVFCSGCCFLCVKGARKNNINNERFV